MLADTVCQLNAGQPQLDRNDVAPRDIFHQEGNTEKQNHHTYAHHAIAFGKPGNEAPRPGARDSGARRSRQPPGVVGRRFDIRLRRAERRSALAGARNTNADNLLLDGYDVVAYRTVDRAVEGSAS